MLGLPWPYAHFFVPQAIRGRTAEPAGRAADEREGERLGWSAGYKEIKTTRLELKRNRSGEGGREADGQEAVVCLARS